MLVEHFEYTASDSRCPIFHEFRQVAHAILWNEMGEGGNHSNPNSLVLLGSQMSNERANQSWISTLPYCGDRVAACVRRWSRECLAKLLGVHVGGRRGERRRESDPTESVPQVLHCLPEVSIFARARQATNLVDPREQDAGSSNSSWNGTRCVNESCLGVARPGGPGLEWGDPACDDPDRIGVSLGLQTLWSTDAPVATP